MRGDSDVSFLFLSVCRWKLLRSGSQLRQKFMVLGSELRLVCVGWEFLIFEAAKSSYDSAAYQAVRPHRLKGAIYRGLIVQGVQPHT